MPLHSLRTQALAGWLLVLQDGTMLFTQQPSSQTCSQNSVLCMHP